MWEESKKKTSNYSGRIADDIITGPGHYLIDTSKEKHERRRHPRIPCRNVKACIRTAQSATVVVDVLNMSRGGVYFASMQQFTPGAPVAIAMHYIEGGQNMFQNCRVVRAQAAPASTEPNYFAAEFSPS